jgi:hypothetical protein
MWTRLMGFSDDTLWALNRLASLMVLGGRSEHLREGEGPREGSRRLLKEDSLVVMLKCKPKLAGQTQAGQRGRGSQNSPQVIRRR